MNVTDGTSHRFYGIVERVEILLRHIIGLRKVKTC